MTRRPGVRFTYSLIFGPRARSSNLWGQKLVIPKGKLGTESSLMSPISICLLTPIMRYSDLLHVKLFPVMPGSFHEPFVALSLFVHFAPQWQICLRLDDQIIRFQTFPHLKTISYLRHDRCFQYIAALHVVFLSTFLLRSSVIVSPVIISENGFVA